MENERTVSLLNSKQSCDYNLCIMIQNQHFPSPVWFRTKFEARNCSIAIDIIFYMIFYLSLGLMSKCDSNYRMGISDQSKQLNLRSRHNTIRGSKLKPLGGIVRRLWFTCTCKCFDRFTSIQNKIMPEYNLRLKATRRHNRKALVHTPFHALVRGGKVAL